MKTSFSGYVKEKRIEVGLGLREAARAIGISPAYLARIEARDIDPPAREVLQRMAQVYGLEERVLLWKSKQRGLEDVAEKAAKSADLLALFREASRLDPSTVRAVLEGILKQQNNLTPEEATKAAQQIVEEMERLENGELHREGRAGMFSADVRPRVLSRRDLEKMADRCLSAAGVCSGDYELPIQVDVLIEQAGIEIKYWSPVKCLRDPNSSVWGLAKWGHDDDAQTRPEIHLHRSLVERTDTLTEHQKRFTLGHEYFHAIEHLPMMREQLGVRFLRDVTLIEHKTGDRMTLWRKGKSGPKRLQTREDWREFQANCFSAFLLMPRWAITDELRSVQGLDVYVDYYRRDPREACYELAAARQKDGTKFHAKFGVSRAAMTYHLDTLGVLQELAVH